MDLLVPLGVLATATLGLVFLVEPFVSWYFQWAWWSYVFLADGVARRAGAPSLVRGRTRELVWLCGVSVVLWTFFEGVNLRLGNWYYVMDHPSRAARWVGGVVAFATVIPAILATESALSKVRWLGHVPVRRLRWSRRGDVACLTLGVACVFLPLVWPDLFFPLAWGSLVFLLEPWNRRHARRSVLRDLEAGEAAPLLRVLLAGLVCGFLWELWNFWARTKWVYTVPGVGALKLFEMPVLGFLGFPPFAVECQSVVRFLEARRERATTTPLPRRRVIRWVTTGFCIAATAAIFATADARTVDSLYAPIERLDVLTAPGCSRLVASGLRSPEALLRALSTEDRTREWSLRTGIPTGELVEIRERVALVMHRGLGQDRARELEGLGIRTRGELAGWSPERLAAALRARGARGPERFLERRARVWVEGLKNE